MFVNNERIHAKNVLIVKKPFFTPERNPAASHERRYMAIFSLFKSWAVSKRFFRGITAGGLLFFFSSASFGSFLTAKGAKLYNDRGEAVLLSGVNWFGFETTNMFPHGLWKRDYHGVLLQIRDMGFNCIRMPFCNEMLHADTNTDRPSFYGQDPYYLRDKTELNKELAGLAPLQMMDEIIRAAGVLGLVVILDKATHTPLYTVYGGHLANTTFAYCDYNYNLLDYTVNWRDGVFDQRVFWSKGSLRRRWASSDTVQHEDLPSVQMDNDTIRAGNHPLVFIAEGSHAVYPYPGKYVTSVVEGFPGLIEYAGMPSSGTSYALNQIMMPPSTPASNMQNYELRNLNTGRITSYSQNRYLAFSGWMVDVLGDNNARFPPYTTREQDPVAYCSNADTVAWDWIPGDMPDILNNLQGIIDDYVTVTDPLSPF